MLSMPVTLTRLIVRFASLLSKRVWDHAQVLLVGALLAAGKRTGTAGLRVRGLSQEGQFQKYHRVRKRARWSRVAGGPGGFRIGGDSGGAAGGGGDGGARLLSGGAAGGGEAEEN